MYPDKKINLSSRLARISVIICMNVVFLVHELSCSPEPKDPHWLYRILSQLRRNNVRIFRGSTLLEGEYNVVLRMTQLIIP